MTSDQFIEKEAKLFEAGSYPDRGIDISEEDLDRIIEGTAEAPVRIEHADTPFDNAIGFVKSVYRKGRELFGRIAFTKAAWDLIAAANAKRLSVAIKKDKSGIAEVSIVRQPRIADAAVFAGQEVVVFDSPLLEKEGQGEVEFADQAEIVRLRAELADKEADRVIEDLKRAGKLVPASEVFARAILRSGESSVITFAGEDTPVSEVFRMFLQTQPKVIEFSELAPAAPDTDEPGVFAKLGVTAAQVERHRER
jgi:hypothetical protein